MIVKLFIFTQSNQNFLRISDKLIPKAVKKLLTLFTFQLSQMLEKSQLQP